jgi:vesicle-fusing ATPase
LLPLPSPAGSGKSALVATAGLESGFPFVKVVSPESMVGFSETAKASAITKASGRVYGQCVVANETTHVLVWCMVACHES